MSRALVVLYRDCHECRSDGWEEIRSFRVDRTALEDDFRGTLRTELQLFWKDRLSSQVRDHAHIFRYALDCLEDHTDEDQKCLLLRQNDDFLAYIESPRLGIYYSDDVSPLEEPLSEDQYQELLTQVANRVTELMFYTTSCVRDKGGYALVSECTRFQPYGGWECVGS